MLSTSLLLEGVLGDVDVHRPRPPGPRDVERLGDDPGQLVGVPDEVVVLRHRQRDAVDVDLLERVLADQGRRHVAGDRDHRHRIEHGRPDARDEVRGTGPGRAHTDPDRARHPGVAVGGVGPALLVAHEDVAQLRVVPQHVVQGQDHATGVAEEDIDSLAEQGLAQDVGADARALQVTRLMEHALLGTLDRRRAGRTVGGHVTASAPRGRARGSGGIGLHRHDWPSYVADIQKTLASRRGSLR